MCFETQCFFPSVTNSERVTNSELVEMNPKRTDFILIHFLEVGGENVKRNRTLCDLFLGGPLKFEQYWKKKVQNEYVLGIMGSHLF
jgi:hypothetical protein